MLLQPRNGTQTSVLILQKKSEKQKDKEEKSGVMADYNVFMSMVEKVGHDRRGNPLFKRDSDGNEILIPDVQKAEEDSKDSKQKMIKIEDDQTSEVASVFKDWKIKEGIAW